MSPILGNERFFGQKFETWELIRKTEPVPFHFFLSFEDWPLPFPEDADYFVSAPSLALTVEEVSLETILDCSPEGSLCFRRPEYRELFGIKPVFDDQGRPVELEMMSSGNDVLAKVAVMGNPFLVDPCVQHREDRSGDRDYLLPWEIRGLFPALALVPEENWPLAKEQGLAVLSESLEGILGCRAMALPGSMIGRQEDCLYPVGDWDSGPEVLQRAGREKLEAFSPVALVFPR